MAKVRKSTSDDKMIIKAEQSRLVTVTSDPLAPTHIPKSKLTSKRTWIKKPSSVGIVYDLGSLSIFGGLMSKFQRIQELSNPEIHVIWMSYCPSETFQQDMTITLYFNQSINHDQSILYQHVCPMHIPSHHIFYPRQTISLGLNSVFPWSVGFDIDDFLVKESFHIGKLQIFLRGYASEGTNYTRGKDSELILLSPIEDIVHTATRISRPRTFGNDWVYGGYKVGTLKPSDQVKMKFLEEEGIDIEALLLTKRLPGVLKVMDGLTSQILKREEVRKSVISQILNTL
ncbi:TPA_asm: protein 3 [Cucumis virus 1]|uniref:Protein 3 n=1 Tax=Cucumis virus 1 TaxID=2977964 RepID=A0A9N6YJC9_9RHAB|nr:TPA_asm: protein 3 [Cucumis virus 1]